MKDMRHFILCADMGRHCGAALLSWTPGDYKIRTGADGHLEHVGAYVLASAHRCFGLNRKG
jgi:hypothetical protein